jgi:hypothetical protein
MVATVSFGALLRVNDTTRNYTPEYPDLIIMSLYYNFEGDNITFAITIPNTKHLTSFIFFYF